MFLPLFICAELHRVVRKVAGWLYLVVQSCTVAKYSHFFLFPIDFLPTFAFGNQNVMPVLLVSLEAIFDKADTKS